MAVPSKVLNFLKSAITWLSITNHMNNNSSSNCLYLLFSEVLMRGDKVITEDIPLYWDSWDHRQHLKNNLSPRVWRSRTSRASVPSEDWSNINNTHLPGGSVSTLAPSCSVSSINSLVLISQTANTTTPPLTPPVLNKTKWGKFRFTSGGELI